MTLNPFLIRASAADWILSRMYGKIISFNLKSLLLSEKTIFAKVFLLSVPSSFKIMFENSSLRSSKQSNPSEVTFHETTSQLITP